MSSGVLYWDNVDRTTKLELIGAMTRRYSPRVLSYCLMMTHAHFILRVREVDLAAAMQWLNSAYARTFNQRHGRHGHVFSERYGCKLIQTEKQLDDTFGYIAVNPVEAFMIGRVELYRWGSFGALMGLYTPPPFLNVPAILARFGNNPDEARARMQAAVDKRIAAIAGKVAA